MAEAPLAGHHANGTLDRAVTQLTTIPVELRVPPAVHSLLHQQAPGTPGRSSSSVVSGDTRASAKSQYFRAPM